MHVDGLTQSAVLEGAPLESASIQLPRARRLAENSPADGQAIKFKLNNKMKTQAFFVDLTERPPRSFRVRLGGFVILARMIDKGRATLSKKNGE